MTSNALMALNGGAELTELEQAILAEQADEVNAFDYIPTRIKFPTGDISAFTTNDGDILKPPFVAVAAVSQKGRAFWPDKDSQGLIPLCSSPDGVKGIFNIDDPDQAKLAASLPIRHPALNMLSGASGPHRCATCPLAQWGSGEGRGQACKSMIKLLLLVKDWSMPVVLTIPPTSIKAWSAYASVRQQKKGQTYYTCWTKFDLEGTRNAQGTKYSILKVSIEKPLSEDEIRHVLDLRRQYADIVRNMGITSEDYDTEGGAVDGRVVDAETGEILDNDGPPF